MAMLAAAADTSGLLAPAARANPLSPANALPGRIVLYRDPAMNGHQAEIDRDHTEACVHHGVRLLTDIDDTAAAFESLFSGLNAASTIAIKVNCLAWNDSRWEVVRGLVSGLAMMLGGSYDVSRVTIFDVQTYLPDHGYVAGEFTFGGNTVTVRSSESCSGYYVYQNHRLSNHVMDNDYVINVPVLKAHNVGYPQHQITTALKNHYGSICPQNLCNNITGMLTLNADANIKGKSALVVTSALRGTYEGGPWEPAQIWNTFPDQTPNTILLTTDPVTESYWARDMINAERVDRGWSEFECPWVEQASEAPYAIGVSDPDSMTVINYDVTIAVEGDDGPRVGTTYLAPNSPNPFSSETRLRFRLAHSGTARIVVISAAGRQVRHLGERSYSAGHSMVEWDGRDDQGRPVPSGVYFVRLLTGQRESTRRVLVAR